MDRTRINDYKGDGIPNMECKRHRMLSEQGRDSHLLLENGELHVVRSRSVWRERREDDAFQARTVV